MLEVSMIALSVLDNVENWCFNWIKFSLQCHQKSLVIRLHYLLLEICDMRKFCGTKTLFKISNSPNFPSIHPRNSKIFFDFHSFSKTRSKAASIQLPIPSRVIRKRQIELITCPHSSSVAHIASAKSIFSYSIRETVLNECDDIWGSLAFETSRQFVKSH